MTGFVLFGNFLWLMRRIESVESHTSHQHQVVPVRTSLLRLLLGIDYGSMLRSHLNNLQSPSQNSISIDYFGSF
jgi:hypothetical protein